MEGPLYKKRVSLPEAHYKGDKMPVTRSFAEPNKTDHLFVAHFKPGPKKIKVIATDRFGEKFTATIVA